MMKTISSRTISNVIAILVFVYFLAWLLFLGFEGDSELDAPAEKLTSAIQFVDCSYHFNDESIKYSGRIECAQFTTDADTGEFSLPVTIIKARKSSRREAVIFVPGGPGQGNITAGYNVEYWYQFLEMADFPFDFILYEPRGTEKASPHWSCPEFDKISRDSLAYDFSVLDDTVQAHPVVVSCLNRYHDFLRDNITQTGPTKGLEVLSSFNQVNDLETILDGLDYDAGHIWGESYGTRVALLSRSEKIKSLILDSPYPLESGILTDWVTDINRRFDIHRNVYANDYASRRFRSFDELWRTVLQAITNDPPTFQVEAQHVVVNRNRLTALAFYVLYMENLRFPFYESLEYLALGQDSGLEIAEDSLNLLLNEFLDSAFSTGFNHMTYYAVECQDNTLTSKEVYDKAVAGSAQYSYLLEGTWDYNICASELFANTRKVNENKPLKKPALILVGEHDPVTPAAWAKELKAYYGELATLYVATGLGHGVSANSDCLPSLYTDFVLGKHIDPLMYCELENH